MSFNKNSQRNTKQSATKPETVDPDKGNLKNYVTDQAMIKVLNKKGITKLFPIQFETFHLIQKGEDIVAKDRTGSGKTLAFSLPIIMKMRKDQKFRVCHKPKFLVILPTRQLAIQVRDQITSLRIKDKEDFVVTAVYGGSGMEEQLDAVSKGADIIVGTPGRLIDFLKRGVLDFSDLETICLDEADEMLKIGFKDDIEQIFQFITKKKKSKIQCLLFSATIPEWIWQISEKYQSKSKKFIDMMKDSNIRTSKTVQHYGLKANPTEKEAYIGSIIKHFLKGKSGKVIIFCETKREVDRIGKSGLIPLSVAFLHGDIKQFIREKVFRQFKNGQVDCLIATNVAARGLDFPEIDLIIQMQPPTTTDAYIHRSGRTGRAGKSGVCVTMYSFKEENNMKKIEDETMIILHQVNSRDLTKSAVGYQAKDSAREHQQKNEPSRERGYGKERDFSRDKSYGFNGSENKMKQQVKSRDDRRTSDEDLDY